jgi:hypothetical protein
MNASHLGEKLIEKLLASDRYPKVFMLSFRKEAGCCTGFKTAPSIMDMSSGLGRKG